MKITKEDVKRDFCISEVFIKRIDYLTDFNKGEFDGNTNKKEISLTNNLTANYDCKFLGRYYKFKNGVCFWVGYDFRETAKHHFYISIHNKDVTLDKLICENIPAFEKQISIIDNKNPWYNVYLDEALIYLQNFSFRNSQDEAETKNNYDDSKNEIFEILQNIERKISSEK